VGAVRLVLVDTADQLPGLLPLHAWSALMQTELVLVGRGDHPFLAHLDAAELAYQVVPEQTDDSGSTGLSRQDLLSGVSLDDRRRARWVVDLVQTRGAVAYLFGSADHESFTRTLGMEAARREVEVEVVYFGVTPRGVRLLDLVQVEERLQGPGGCPWDRQQTHASLARYAVEEVYELLEAIEGGEPGAIAEELGDVLLQVVFHAQIAAAVGDFTIDDVAARITEKLVRRHPHVFADVEVESADEVMANWEQLKADEKPERSGLFDGVVQAQPALGLATKLQSRAAKVGFDWADDTEALAAVYAEVEEVAGAVDDDERRHELGDLLFAATNLCRHHGIDAESALRAAAGRFRRRLEHIEQTAGRPVAELTREEWLRRWEQARP
jgi:XTP/dITP diphosphohydrolase